MSDDGAGGVDGSKELSSRWAEWCSLGISVKELGVWRSLKLYVLMLDGCSVAMQRG
jgi:hypothetical protein